MNFAFYNAYQKQIEPLIFGVPFTLEQRAKATDAIWRAIEDCCKPCWLIGHIECCISRFVHPVNGVKNRLADAYIKVVDREYRDPADFYNICQNIIMQTEQKTNKQEVKA